MAAFDDATLERHGVTREEYDRIVSLMGREPNLTELGLFSVMWSEHCSYKSSRVHLKTLPTEGPQVLQGPGENAGAVDIGGGLRAVEAQVMAEVLGIPYEDVIPRYSDTDSIGFTTISAGSGTATVSM